MVLGLFLGSCSLSRGEAIAETCDDLRERFLLYRTPLLNTFQRGVSSEAWDTAYLLNFAAQVNQCEKKARENRYYLRSN